MATKKPKIGEKSVSLRANASFLLIYKDEFGREALADVFPMLQMVLPIIGLAQGEALDSTNALALVDGIEKFNTETLVNLIWAMAKNADPSIDEPREWLDTFDDFPLFDILAELTPFLLESMISKKKAPLTAQAAK